ncbi:1,2-phenylacetyl-CoA epoxidase subunit PaaD [Ideonella sp.]|uniref:1,2-phenylacetyl-CoA epoxidase subunit PaaD n=1 Tax=Ideonella sp. TaxID=1929293 RepID=UPI0039C8905C
MPADPRWALPATPARRVGEGRIERAWGVLGGVPDPEVPALSVVDLGLVREIAEAGAGLSVIVTPTYSGCPATEVINEAIRQALEDDGLGPIEVTTRRSPAWTTDWMSDAGRARLAAYGIAPPGRCGEASTAASPIRIRPRNVACPRCGSAETERLSAYGSTACKALYRCLACQEPFEHFKPI